MKVKRRRQKKQKRKNKIFIKNRKIKKLKRTYVLIFILAIFLSVSITEFVYFFYKIKYVKVYDLKLSVSDRVGFALGAEEKEINFGSLPIGSSIVRKIFIANNGTTPLLANFIVTGNIKEFIYIENRSLTLDSGGERIVGINAVVLKDSEFGNYTGKLILIFKRI
jgi:hypothetical protein